MIATTEMVTTSRSFPLECESEDDVITRSLRETGTWEEYVARAIDDYLEPGWTFLDVGAHIGYFSILAGLRGNHVVAIEANPKYLELLSNNARLNDVPIEIASLAVADYEGEGFLKRDARFVSNPGASYLAKEGEPVLVTRLETILYGRLPEFIKFDIEGLEYAVMKDSPSVLDAAQVIVVEVGKEMCGRYGVSIWDVVTLLRAHGFGVTFMDGSPIDERFVNIEVDQYTNLLARKGVAEESTALKPMEQVDATLILCAYRSLTVPTAECLLQLQDRGWRIRIGSGDALIQRVRSRQVSKWFRSSDDDVFLMLDDDIVFLPEDAERLVRHAKETRSIVVGAYPVKSVKDSHLACRVTPGTTIIFGPDISPRPEMDLIEIVYPATGFMAVHRDVIEALTRVLPLCNAEKGVDGSMWPFFDTFWLTGDDGNSDYLSEDYAFGERARQLGFKTYLDPSIILAHMGDYAYHVHGMRTAVPVEAPR